MKKLLLACLLLAGYAGAQDTSVSIEDAKARVAMKMKDPESARFAGVTRDPKGNTVCGWVNAKNSYGGYVGYKPFFVMGRFVEIRDDGDEGISNRGLFAVMWKGCGLLPEGESFGDSKVKLASVNIERSCAGKRKRSDKPELYANCEQDEANAKTWLESHGTSSMIAYACGEDIRRYNSYSSGKQCVTSREANEIMDRGPIMDPAAKP